MNLLEINQSLENICIFASEINQIALAFAEFQFIPITI